MTRQAILNRRAPARLRSEDGFMLIELLAAMLVLAVGVVAILTTYDTSRRFATNAEVRDVMVAEARGEIQRVEALPWSSVAVASAPTENSGATSTDPTYYISSGPCPGSSNPPQTSPCYQWDWTNSSSTEPIVVNSNTTDTYSDPYAWSDVISTTNSKTRISGWVYRFITWVNDPECTSSACGGSNDYKRITVAVKTCAQNSSGQTCTNYPQVNPVEVSVLYGNPAGGPLSPLTASGVNCLDGGTTVPCTH